ncbi:MAG: type IV secretion system DNA-binding domain-containing protein [Candidatus Moraniibacteriota bacterium]|nr:MAG: type IV secretion system DNA-binding domain-containing protein [Candidatus Moranbacteria bacterium]
MESAFDLNSIFLPILGILGIGVVATGALLLVRLFFFFRGRINHSLNMDLEIVRVSKPLERKGEAPRPDLWKEKIGAMEQLLVSLQSFRGAKHGIDIVGNIKKFFYGPPALVFELANPEGEEEMTFFLSMPKKFRESVEKQVHSFYPTATIEKVKDYTIFSPNGFSAVSTMTLSRGTALPIRTYESLDVDPLNEISNSLSKLSKEGEGAALQIVLSPAGTSWRTEGRRIAREMQQGKRLSDVYHESPFLHFLGSALSSLLSISTWSGKSNELPEEKKHVQLTPEEQELVKAIERKVSKAAFHVNVRLLAAAPTEERAGQILAQMENAFAQFEYPEANVFRTRRARGRSSKPVIFDYIFRSFREESAFILGVEEIASLFHFPISTTETPNIKWQKAGAAPPPPDIPKEGILLGYNDYRGMKTDIRLAEDDRRRHLYVIGQTGVGKSVFLQEMAKQDVRAGRGLCFIDPHGDAVSDILAAVPKERAEDIVYFDPSDVERPFGLNMLEFSRPEEKTFVINEMINIFDKLYDLKQTGGPMFEQYMRNAMLLIMEDPASGSTLMEIPKVLADPDFRRMKLERCKNPIVYDFWVKEAEKAGGEAALANMVPYITSKLTPFVANDMMRPIIAQQKSTIDFRMIMDEGKILLINLSKGKLGETNSHLLGMIVAGKILMAALARADMKEESRRDFSFYIDEFQNVTTDSIAQILSEARKYRLNLIIAHQFIGQLSENISKAVFGNVGSLVAFRVGPEDAEFLEKQFEPIFTARDLVNVDNRKAFVRLLINSQSSKPFNLLVSPPTSGDEELALHLRELSRLRFGRDVDIVHREIMERTKLAEGIERGF